MTPKLSFYFLADSFYTSRLISMTPGSRLLRKGIDRQYILKEDALLVREMSSSFRGLGATTCYWGGADWLGSGRRAITTIPATNKSNEIVLNTGYSSG